MPKTLPELAALRLSGSQNLPIATTTNRDEARQVDSIEKYEILRAIGKGNFGKVLLGRRKKDGLNVAIKAIKKTLVIENDEFENIETEVEVFQIAQLEAHPFLVQPVSFFSDSVYFYFVMEYVGGGDLMFHIQKRKFTLEEARFYAAQVLLSLEYLHKHQIVYRDLKLDNIMMMADGYIKLTDYGLCKAGIDWKKQMSTFCGTPEFIAPEILSERSYTRAVDWWAFGVLVYELVLGQVISKCQLHII